MVTSAALGRHRSTAPASLRHPRALLLAVPLFGKGGAGKGASLQPLFSLSSAPPLPPIGGAPLGPRGLALSKQVAFWSGGWLCGARQARACLLGGGAGGREILRA